MSVTVAPVVFDRPPSASPPVLQPSMPLAVGRSSRLDDLRRWFAADFREVVIDALGKIGDAAKFPLSTEALEACRRAENEGRPQVVRLVDGKLFLAMPSISPHESERVAVAEVGFADDDALLRTAELWLEKTRTELCNEDLRREAAHLSEHIGATFEEISLIYRLTQNLSLSRKPAQLGAQALEWLHEVIPCEGSLLCLDTAFDEDLFHHEDAGAPTFVTHGRTPISPDAFLRLLDKLNARQASKPLVVNHGVPDDAAGEFADVHELVVVPLAVGERQFGRLAIFNHAKRREFGTSEASLLASVGTILGIHSGNIDLYQQQADLFSGTVRAMSSAIDAKDPYTRGHSDRVARVSVRLAQELGCDDDTQRTIYLAGLLHDIGKIGIDDNVLRKPGKLTDMEYEHIKTHAEIGYRILRGLRKMGHVLPVVLHHHESWDGKGYPFGLVGTNIPFLARICAVADAYDAMSSDRPYRKGMEDEKLDAIFRNGAGRQWDPDVVNAFFRIRDDIREISLRTPDAVDAVTIDWTH